MGNTDSVEQQKNDDEFETVHEDDFETEFLESPYAWPKNLYEEARDMMAISFLMYTFAYILETARREESFIGLTQEGGKPGQIQRTNIDNTDFERSFTPTEVLQLVTDNLDLLINHFPTEFRETSVAYESFQMLQERVKSQKVPRPLTIEEFDDKHQKHELVYGIGVDRINKRVTLVFRGTENELSFSSNWSTNLAAFKASVELPECLKRKKNISNSLEIHKGFYNYLFDKTFDDTDDPNRKKFDEITDDLVRVLSARTTGYKLYVTGHSLGGALASVAAFFLACDDRFPNPVTCITAAQPRVGNSIFLESVQALERDRKLRMCRFVNDNDAIPLVPTIRYYHAGFQVRLPRKEEGKSPEVSYPKLKDTWRNKLGRTWDNSLITNFDLKYDHADYRERLEACQNDMEKLDLNKLYADSSLTGWLNVHAKLDLDS